jgi:hypothetical protein
MAKTILERTAEAIFRADEAPKKVIWSEVSRPEQRRYEVMAAAALSVALRLTLDEELDISSQLMPIPSP